MSEESRFQPRVGCAGWCIRKDKAEFFPPEGSHLERYSHTFNCVEINSSFYRPHRPNTYARWANTVSPGFQFAVKVPKEITHVLRLEGADEALARFVSEAGCLAGALGPLLVQLPPSLGFQNAAVKRFFAAFRDRFAGAIVCEPRHPSWFEQGADRCLADFHVARVAADPILAPGAGEPGGWSGLIYYRLHGSPRVYYSSYTSTYLKTLTRTLRSAAETVPTWCIFDNTALGAATANALTVRERLACSVSGLAR